MQDPPAERCSSCKRELAPGNFVQLTIDGGQLCLECAEIAHMQRVAEEQEYRRGR